MERNASIHVFETLTVFRGWNLFMVTVPTKDLFDLLTRAYLLRTVVLYSSHYPPIQTSSRLGLHDDDHRNGLTCVAVTTI